MLLSVFILSQLVLDVALVVLVAALLRSRSRPAPAPPEWYGRFLRVAGEVLAATEPLLDSLEGRAAGPDDEGPGPARYRRAAACLRAGLGLDEAARRTGLGPGELRLLSRVVAAETAARPADGAGVGRPAPGPAAGPAVAAGGTGKA